MSGNRLVRCLLIVCVLLTHAGRAWGAIPTYPGQGTNNTTRSGYASPQASNPSGLQAPNLPGTPSAELVRPPLAGVKIGTWDVKPDGQFTYSKSLDLPEGRQGIQPKLAIEYSSNPSNGMLGVGFRLKGIPCITRIDAESGVRFLGSDSFAPMLSGCDGAPSPADRLVVVSAVRTIPSDSKQYRTITGSWGLYTSSGQGSCGDGPCQWQLEDGSGVTYYFGGDTSLPGSAAAAPVEWERTSRLGIRRWHLYRVRDLVGNYYEVNYRRVGDRLYPSQIEYTKSFAATPSTRTIIFNYEARPDTFAPDGTLRLANIEVKSKDLPVRRYVLAYYGEADRRSRLSSITEQGNDYSSASPTSLPPVRFTWTDPPPPRGEIKSAGQFSFTQAGVAPGQWHAADLDGDGKAEIVQVLHGVNTPQGPDRHQIEIVRGGAFDANPPSNWISPMVAGFQVTASADRWTSHTADINGDGKSDIVLVHADWEGITIRYILGGPISTPTWVDWGTESKATSARAPSADPLWMSQSVSAKYPNFWQTAVADVNGDHVDDIVFVQPCDRRVGFVLGRMNGIGGKVSAPSLSSFQILPPPSSTTFSKSLASCVAGSPAGISLVDVNGDRRKDLVIGYATDIGLAVLFSLGSSSGLSTPQVVQALFTLNLPTQVVDRLVPVIVSGDINGDGNSDTIFVYQGHRGRFTAMSLGSSALGVLPPAQLTLDNTTSFPSRVHTPDGAEDMVGCPTLFVGVACPETRGWDYQIADHNGDGIGDLVAAYRGAFGAFASVSLGSPTGLMPPLDAPENDPLTKFPDPWNNNYGSSGPVPEFVRKFPSDVYVDPWRHATADLNGDGLADLASVYLGSVSRFSTSVFGGGSVGTDIAISHSRPNGFGPLLSLPQALPPFNWLNDPPIIYNAISTQGDGKIDSYSVDHFPSAAQVSDYDGDGVSDLVLMGWHHAAISGSIASSVAPAPMDFLSDVANGYGGTIHVSYQPSALHAVRTAGCTGSLAPPCGVPATGSRPLAVRVDVSNGFSPGSGPALGESFAYSYSNERFQPDQVPEHRSLGFTRVSRREVNTGAKVETEYNVTPPFEGRPFREVTYNSASKIVSAVEYTYELAPNSARLPAPIAMPRISRKSHYIYEAATQLSAYQFKNNYTYAYDDFGQIIGLVECSDDLCTRQTFSYAHDTAGWLRDRRDSVKVEYVAPLSSSLANPLPGTNWQLGSLEQSFYDPVPEKAQQIQSTRRVFCNATGTPVRDATSVCVSGRWVPVAFDIHYDAFSNVIDQKDGLGRLTSFTYDPDFRTYTRSTTRSLRRPFGQAPVDFGDLSLYDALGRLTYHTDVSGIPTTFSYDALGRLSTKSLADGGRTDFTYNSFGNVAAQHVQQVSVVAQTPTGTLGDLSKLYFDGNGIVYRRDRSGDDCRGIVEEWKTEFRSGQRVEAKARARYSNEIPVWTEVFRDSANRVLHVDRVSGAARKVLLTNQFFGDLVISTDGNGHTHEEYINGRRQVRTRKTTSTTLKLSYDFLGRLTDIVPSSGQLDRRVYDSLGRIAQETDPARNTTQYEYDDVGNLTRRWSSIGTQTNYLYDDLDRLRQESSGSTALTYQYDDDLKGALSVVSEPAGATSLRYDAMGRVKLRAFVPSGASSALTEQYEYDLLGRPKQKLLPDGTKLGFAYHSGGELGLVLMNDQVRARYSNYTATALPERRQSAWDQRTDHDPTDIVVTRLRYLEGTTTRGDLRYGYDGVFNIRSVEGLNNQGIRTSLWTFTHTNEDFLQSASLADGTGTAQFSEAYTYSNEDLATKGAVTFVRSGLVLRGTSVLQVGIPPVRTTIEVLRATYDGAGRCTEKVVEGVNTWTYSYDHRDRLVSVTKNGALLNEYSYNYAGERVRTKDYGASTLTTYRTSPNYELRLDSASPLQVERSAHVLGRADEPVVTVRRAVTGAFSLEDGNRDSPPLKYAIDFGSSASGHTADPPPPYVTSVGLLAALLLMALFARGRWALAGPLVAVLCSLTIPASGQIYSVTPPAVPAIGYITPQNATYSIPAFLVPAGAIGAQACATQNAASLTWELQNAPGSPAYPTFDPVVPTVPSVPLGNARDRDYYYFQDYLGSTRFVLEKPGATPPIREGLYQPFGGKLSVANSALPSNLTGDTRFKYAGQILEESNGLYWMSARYYDPAFGRFTTPDPTIPGGARLAVGMNRYAYAFQNPVTLVDPDGYAPSIPKPIVDLSVAPTPPDWNPYVWAPVAWLAGLGGGVASFAIGLGGDFLGGMNFISEAERVSANQRAEDYTCSFSCGGLEFGAQLAVLLFDIPLGRGETLRPGPFAKAGIPARGPGRDFLRAERDALNAEGRCHTCGTTNPGTKSGDFIPDHQPPNGLAEPGDPQRLYPHCLSCARKQGGEVNGAKTRKEGE